jgi:predicted NUDIX family phosphoesterase
MSRIVRHTKDIKKHKAFILTIDSTYIENATARTADGLVNVFARPINRYPHELFLEDAQSYLAIREREWCDASIAYVFNELARDLQVGPYLLNAKGEKKEGDPKYKQLLPYMIARQLQADGTYLYFPYRRTKQVGESRLAGNGSLGYGGHIDLEDVVSTKSVIDLRATILKSAWREAFEEFTLKPTADNNEVLTNDHYKNAISFGDLFIVDNSNDVGELHLGIIMYFDVPQGWTLEASEDELAKLPPMTAEEMLADPTFNPENWTRIYLEHVASEPAKVEEQQADPVSDLLNIDHGGVRVGLVPTDKLEAIIGELKESTASYLDAQAPVSEAAALNSAVEVNTLIGKDDAIPVFSGSDEVEEKKDVIKVADDGAAY